MGCNSSKDAPIEVGVLPHNTKNFMKYYEMGPKVGTGTFAHVRVCRHIASGDQRVVKIMAKPCSYEDFSMEVALLQTINQGGCANIVVFYEYFEDKRFFYSVMEYCRGGDLFSYVANRSSPTTEETISDWMRQILTAIAHIHLHGIVHRDIKPANLLFADQDHSVLKVIDLGLSFKMRKGELLAEPCGTPQSLAPEMILGRYGRKVDIWAVGIILYMMLFGCRPFVSDNDADLFREIVETEPSFYPRSQSSYDPTVLAKDFCRLLLLKDSRQRPTATEALKHPWLDCKQRVKRMDSEIPANILIGAHEETTAMEKQRPTINTECNKSDVGRSFSNLGRDRSLSRKQTRVNVQQYADLTHKIDQLRAEEAFPNWRDDLEGEGAVLMSPEESRARLLSHSGRIKSRPNAITTVAPIIEEEPVPSNRVTFKLLSRKTSTTSILSTSNEVSTAASSTTVTKSKLPRNTPSADTTPKGPPSQAPAFISDPLNSSSESTGYEFFNGGWVQMNPESFCQEQPGILHL